MVFGRRATKKSSSIQNTRSVGRSQNTCSAAAIAELQTDGAESGSARKAKMAKDTPSRAHSSHASSKCPSRSSRARSPASGLSAMSFDSSRRFLSSSVRMGRSPGGEVCFSRWEASARWWWGLAHDRRMIARRAVRPKIPLCVQGAPASRPEGRRPSTDKAPPMTSRHGSATVRPEGIRPTAGKRRLWPRVVGAQQICSRRRGPARPRGSRKRPATRVPRACGRGNFCGGSRSCGGSCRA